MKIAVCSICSANYLPRVSILMDSLRVHAPSWNRFVLVAEEPELRARISRLENEEMLFPDTIGAAKWREMAFAYEITEFNTALKPFLMRFLLSLGYDAVVYFDPDIEVYSKLEELEGWIRDHDAVVTPHLTSPPNDDGSFPRAEDIFRGGQFNLGFLALRKSEAATNFLDWWGKTLETKCLKDVSNGYFVDQSWADLIASFVPRLKIVHHTGYNVAYWNLSQRSVSLGEAGWEIHGDPLVFFHFSGFREDAVSEISHHQKRHSAPEGTVLYRLLKGYADKIAERAARFTTFPYSFATFRNGKAITMEERRAFLRLPEIAKAAFGNPFENADKIGPLLQQAAAPVSPEVARLRKELHHLHHTPSWVIGRAITWLPRMVRKRFRLVKFPRPTLAWETWHRRAKILSHEAKAIFSFLGAVAWVSYRRFIQKKRVVGIHLVEHLGDIVACEPVARHARKLHPGAIIVWCVRPAFREIVDCYPEVDRSLVLTCMSASSLLCKIGVFSEIIDLTIPGRRCWECHTWNIQSSDRHGTRLSTKNYFDHGSLLSAFCQFAGLPPLNEPPKLTIPEETKRTIDRLELPREFICVHARSNDVGKDWPTEKWHELVEMMTSRWNLPIVEVGLKSELEHLQHPQIRNLCDRLSLLETAETIRRSTVFIGIDSGPAHLANALGTQGVILMGRYKHFEAYMPFTGGYGDGTSADILRAAGPVSSLPVTDVLASLERTISHETI